MLVSVPYFSLRRTDEGRRNSRDEHIIKMALRWRPPIDPPWTSLEEAINLAKGYSALNRLAEGDDVALRFVEAGIAYLNHAISYYENEEQEPYPGRNNEALADLRILLSEVVIPVQVR